MRGFLSGNRNNRPNQKTLKRYLKCLDIIEGIVSVK